MPNSTPVTTAGREKIDGPSGKPVDMALLWQYFVAALYAAIIFSRSVMA